MLILDELNELFRVDTLQEVETGGDKRAFELVHQTGGSGFSNRFLEDLPGVVNTALRDVLPRHENLMAFLDHFVLDFGWHVAHVRDFDGQFLEVGIVKTLENFRRDVSTECDQSYRCLLRISQFFVFGRHNATLS